MNRSEVIAQAAARQITLADAARMLKCSPTDLVREVGEYRRQRAAKIGASRLRDTKGGEP